MLDGWYCRSIANKQAEDEAQKRSAQRNALPSNDDYSSESSQSEPPEQIDYKLRCATLKKKLKFLIYENEYYQDVLRTSQKKLLKACRDRSFLLDRLLQYEKPENTSSDSDDSDSSENGRVNKHEPVKRRKTEPSPADRVGGEPSSARRPPAGSQKPRKRPPPQKRMAQNAPPPYHQVANSKTSNLGSDGHMTPEEVERHLQSRQSFLELMPERAPPTVPTEMFSNDPSLDSESNDILENSPYNIGDEWVE